MQQAFAVYAGALPDRRRHPFLRRLCERAITNTPGLLDWAESDGKWTLMIFGTRPHAEKAIAAMKKSRNPVEETIYMVEMDCVKHNFLVKGPLED